MEWVEVARRGENHHVLYFDLMTQTMLSNKVGETFSQGFVFVPTGFRQFAGARWFSKKDVEHYTDLMKKAAKEGKVLAMGLAWEQVALRTRSFASSVRGKDYSKATTEELAQVFQKYCEVAINHWGHAYHYMMLNRFLPDEVSVEVVKKIKEPEKQREALRILFTSDKPTEIREENIAFVKLAEYLLENNLSAESPDVEALFKKHLEKYAHLGRYYLRSKPYSKKDIIERLSHLNREELNKKKSQFEEQEKTAGKSKQLIKELDLPKHVEENIYAVKQFAFAANYADESYSYLVEGISSFMKEICRRLGLTWDELCSMRSAEVLDALKTGSVPQELKRELKERFSDHALVLENGKIVLYVGKNLADYYNLQGIDKEDYSHVTELKGLSASPGSSRGPVVVVLLSKDLGKVKKGDVLVTTMTTPEFVPAMERASAVVTDEGGILCHAAIVSRELHLPCVVGTKIATKAFKDGTMVDVDAKNGVVKIVGAV